MESPESTPAHGEKPSKGLPRLPAGYYRGFTAVHWQMTIEGRATGWLRAGFHPTFRELLLHTMSRYDLVCPVYCLMPDHLHLLWMGVAADADQRTAAKFLRQHMNALLERYLPDTRLQKQAYDHVLRQEEKGPDAVRAVAWYLLQNPVRAGLVDTMESWLDLGCMVPGYPTLHPLEEGYWENFWKIREVITANARSK
jgi:REP element-mobilizing transposase RayT